MQNMTSLSLLIKIYGQGLGLNTDRNRLERLTDIHVQPYIYTPMAYEAQEICGKYFPMKYTGHVTEK